MNVKALVFEKGLLSRVHSILISQGFTKIGFGQSVTYRATLRDSSTESVYWLEIPVDEYHKGPNEARLGKPLLYGEERIPNPVREAAESKVLEIADYLKNSIGKRVDHLSKKIQHNSRMAHTEEEMKRLGKEMESLQTNAELYSAGWTPDPLQ
ncbi:MAG TPA: hypothetical protein VGI04_08780 [Neobacillus sp.]